MADKPDGRHPRMEKYLLRKAFDRPEQPYLPERVLWRQKEQFSDGVGYSWVDGLKAHAAKVRNTVVITLWLQCMGWQGKDMIRQCVQRRRWLFSGDCMQHGALCNPTQPLLACASKGCVGFLACARSCGYSDRTACKHSPGLWLSVIMAGA